MSAYSSLKEMYKDTTQIIQGKDTAGKTVYLLKQFCFFAVCLLYLIEKCGFREVILSYVNIEITLPQNHKARHDTDDCTGNTASLPESR